MPDENTNAFRDLFDRISYAGNIRPKIAEDDPDDIPGDERDDDDDAEIGVGEIIEAMRGWPPGIVDEFLTDEARPALEAAIRAVLSGS